MAYRPGPGLLVAAAFLGPGTLATATVVGAGSGYGLVWVIAVSMVIAFVAQELAVRIPLASGRSFAESLLEGVPGRAGRWVVYGSVAAVVVGAAAFQAGNLAGASLGLEVLSTGPGAFWVVAVADVAFLLLWFGRYELLEGALAVLVVVMAAAFGVQVALVGVDGGALARGLVPSLGAREVGVALALLGTTVVPYNLFLHTSAVEEDRGRDPQGLGEVRADLAVSIVLGGLVTACVVFSAAEALPGRRVASAADMAAALSPLLGRFAEVTVGVGLAAAGVSSAVTAPLAAAWAVDQVRGGRSARPPRLVWIPVLGVGTIVALVGFEPVGLIVTAQVVNALILPVLLGACLVVANREGLGRRANGWLGNAAGVAAFVVSALLVARLAW